MIQEDKLIEQLNGLRGINPSDEFARKLKGIVLSTPRPQRHIFGININLSLPIKESIGFAFSAGLVAVVIMLLLGVTPQAVSPILGKSTPGADSVSMLNQANAAVNDIDIHLAEVDTFDAAAQKTSNALSNISPSSINQERNSISSSDANGSDDAAKIDSVLDQLSK